MHTTSDSDSIVNTRHILRSLPGLYIFLNPSFTILDASDDYLTSTLTTRENLIGKSLFEAFPSNLSTPAASSEATILKSLEYVVKHRKPHTIEEVQRHDVPNASGEFEEKYWCIHSKPVLDSTGELQYIIHWAEDVTEAQKKKQQQEIAENNLSSFIEASGGISWDYDIHKEKIIWSNSFEQAFGYPTPPEGEDAALWSTRVHPDEYQAINASIDQALAKKERSWVARYRYRKANNTYTHVMDHGYILYDAKGEPYRMLGTLVDIEDQMENERLANENNKRFELISKATNDVIWDWDLVTDYIWWNDGFKTTYGYKQEDIEHDINSWYSRLHPEDAERVVSGIHQVIDAGGTNWQDEYRFRKADGTYADIFDRGIVARNEKGQPLRMIGAMLDLTEKNRYAAELKASEQHVRALLEGIPEIAWVAQADGYINYYNKAWYTYTGNTNPDQGWDKIVHPDDLAITIEHWTTALATGQEYTNEARLKRAADGQYRWFTMRATPLYDTQGQIQAWIGVDTDIQDQKDIQQQLIERDEYVQRMLAQAPVQFAVLKRENWMVDFATPHFKQMVGNRDVVGKSFKEALPELEHQGFFSILDKVFATGTLYRGNEQPAYLDRKGDGNLELGFFDFIYQPLFNVDNQVEGVMILIVEVTEQVEAQQQAEKLTQELKASHDRITQILDALPHMTFTTRPDGYVDFYSQQWYDFLGGTRESLTGWGWEDYLHPEDLENTICSWHRSLNTGENFVVENRWLAKEHGEYRWFLVRGVPVKDAEGNITMWVGSHTDIHEQKQTQLALQELTKNFQFLADSMPQLVWTADATGYNDYFNKRWVEFTGSDQEASKGHHIWNKLLHPDDQERASHRWKDSLETGQPYQIEYRFKRASDGEWRWFLGRALPMRDQEGNIVKWFGTCTDIEEQKRNEELMAQTNHELRSINEDLDSFVYTASHDLKLPIINMAGIFKELVNHATFHDPDAELLIGMFDKSLTQINATISDLAEIVKVQKNINTQREEIQLQDLVEEVNLSIKDMVQESDAEIETDFAQVPTLVFSHVNLKSIFYNLISNAIKYRSPDRKPVVVLKTERQANFVKLVVKDNGMGMDLEKHGPKMFQMFKRFHNHVPGSGLGLYIINRIMQKNGGNIEVKSEENKGTTFTLYFKETEPPSEHAQVAPFPVT